jgi:hypothetical protein
MKLFHGVAESGQGFLELVFLRFALDHDRSPLLEKVNLILPQNARFDKAAAGAEGR